VGGRPQSTKKKNIGRQKKPYQKVNGEFGRGQAPNPGVERTRGIKKVTPAGVEPLKNHKFYGKGFEKEKNETLGCGTIP